jgi:hypothetical protein
MKVPTRLRFALLLSSALSRRRCRRKGAPKKAAELALMKYISTDDAPKAIGPYAGGCRRDSSLRRADPADPKSGELVGGESSSPRNGFDNLRPS